MTLPTTGPISANDILTEFGGTSGSSFSIEDYYRGAGIVPRVEPGTVADYPATGGIAIENLGSIALTVAAFGWPSGTANVLGQNANWTYEAGSGTGASTRVAVQGRLNYTGTDTFNLRGARVDIDYNATVLDEDGTSTPTLRLDVYNAGSEMAAFNAVLTNHTISELGNGTASFNFPDTDINVTTNWSLRPSLSDSEVPITLEILAVRISFTTDEFRRPGVVYPATGGLAIVYDNPTAFTIADNNNLDTGWQTGAPTLFGETAGWTYTAQSPAVVASQGALNNALSGVALNLSTVGRIDVDITVSNIQSDIMTSTETNILVRQVEDPAMTGNDNFIGTAGQASYRVVDHTITEGDQTVTLVRTGTGLSIRNDQGLRFAVTETASEFTPFDIAIRAVRISFSDNEFALIGNSGTTFDREYSSQNPVGTSEWSFRRGNESTSPFIETISGWPTAGDNSYIAFDLANTQGVTPNLDVDRVTEALGLASLPAIDETVTLANPVMVRISFNDNANWALYPVTAVTHRTAQGTGLEDLFLLMDLSGTIMTQGNPPSSHGSQRTRFDMRAINVAIPANGTISFENFYGATNGE